MNFGSRRANAAHKVLAIRNRLKCAKAWREAGYTAEYAEWLSIHKPEIKPGRGKAPQFP